MFNRCNIVHPLVASFFFIGREKNGSQNPH
jgi:hypothetical protein